MRLARPLPRIVLLPLLPLLLLPGCIHRFYTEEAVELDRPTEHVAVQSSLRVHLADGGVVLFRGGAIVSPERITGTGIRYDLARIDSVQVRSVDMDSVAGIESFRRELQAGKSAAVSVGATALATVLTVGGLVAIACAMDPKCFGSCPTVYSHDTGDELLEAELFSYSIAPLLEGRDVDVLAARADGAGVLRLEVRNGDMPGVDPPAQALGPTRPLRPWVRPARWCKARDRGQHITVRRFCERMMHLTSLSGANASGLRRLGTG